VPLAWAIAALLEFIYSALSIKERPPVTRYLVKHLQSDFHFSIEKARKELGYSPSVPFEESISRIAAWYKQYKNKGD
jgi:nucleoside-diphosphate-sugar epimerase